MKAGASKTAPSAQSPLPRHRARPGCATLTSSAGGERCRSSPPKGVPFAHRSGVPIQCCLTTIDVGGSPTEIAAEIVHRLVYRYLAAPMNLHRGWRQPRKPRQESDNDTPVREILSWHFAYNAGTPTTLARFLSDGRPAGCRSGDAVASGCGLDTRIGDSERELKYSAGQTKGIL